MKFIELENFIRYIYEKGWSISTINIIIDDNDKKNLIIKRYNDILKKVNTFNDFTNLIDSEDDFNLKNDLKLFVSLIKHEYFIGNILFNNNLRIDNKENPNKNLKFIIKNESNNTKNVIDLINNKKSLLSEYVKKINKNINKQPKLGRLLKTISIKETESEIIDNDNNKLNFTLKVYINNEKIKCYHQRIAFPNTILFKLNNGLVIVNNKIIFPTNYLKNKEEIISNLKKIFLLYFKLYNIEILEYNKVLLNVKKVSEFNNFIYANNKHKIICTKKYTTIKFIDSKKDFDKKLSIINSTINKSTNYLKELNKYSNLDILTAKKKTIRNITSFLNNEIKY